MGDWKEKLSNHPSYSGGGQMKKCACGNEIKRTNTDICGVCFSKRKQGGNATSPTRDTPSSTSFSGVVLPKGYLDGGYFEIKNGKQYIREEVFITWAKEMSASLKAEGLAPAAIRRFFIKLRAIEYKLAMTKDFDRAREGIYAFSRDVAYTEGRGITKPLFSKFIELNCSEAKKDAEHFRAFVEHLQSVVAYFKEK